MGNVPGMINYIRTRWCTRQLSPWITAIQSGVEQNVRIPERVYIRQNQFLAFENDLTFSVHARARKTRNPSYAFAPSRKRWLTTLVML